MQKSLFNLKRVDMTKEALANEDNKSSQKPIKGPLHFGDGGLNSRSSVDDTNSPQNNTRS